MGAALPQPVSAQVSIDDFNALKKMVEQLGDKVQKLEQTHEQDQKGARTRPATHPATATAVGRDQNRRDQCATDRRQCGQGASGLHLPSARPKARMHNFTMVGDAETQFGKTAGQHSAFDQADFAPIFLFRASDDVLFEAGFDFILDNNANMISDRAPGNTTSVNLSFATLDYLLNDYMTLAGRRMLLPLGTYSERSAGWLNKIPDDPMVRDTIVRHAARACELRGRRPGRKIRPDGHLCRLRRQWTFLGSDQSIASAGALGSCGGNVGNTGNWHANPSGGGRLGWFFPGNLITISNWAFPARPGEWSDSGNVSGRPAWWMRRCTSARTSK